MIQANTVYTVHCIYVYTGKGGKDVVPVDEDLAERMSAMRRPGESEMDYYERRYQERVGQNDVVF